MIFVSVADRSDRSDFVSLDVVVVELPAALDAIRRWRLRNNLLRVLEHDDEETTPLPAATGLSDFTVGLLGVALVAFLVYTVARTAE